MVLEALERIPIATIGLRNISVSSASAQQALAS